MNDLKPILAASAWTPVEMPVKRATGRDMDLFLVEELSSSPDFIEWLLLRVGISEADRGTAITRTRTRRRSGCGDTEICLTVDTKNGPAILLIENRMEPGDAPDHISTFQAEARTLKDGFVQTATILVTPSHAVDQADDADQPFDHVVRYEEIASFLEQRAAEVVEELSRRLTHRAQLIKALAARKCHQQKTALQSGKQRFAARYIQQVSQDAPELIPGPGMMRKGTSESTTMIFDPETLPNWPFLPRMRIAHHLREGKAKITFYSWGECYTALAALAGGDLAGSGISVQPGGTSRKAGGSALTLVADAPRIDHLKAFDDQLDEIRAGIGATRAMLAWVKSHEAQVHRWSTIVARLAA